MFQQVSELKRFESTLKHGKAPLFVTSSGKNGSRKFAPFIAVTDTHRSWWHAPVIPQAPAGLTVSYGT